MRKVLQRLSRGVVLKRRLPREFGGAVVLVSPDASLRYWKPTLEGIDPRLFDAVRELVRPGDMVWDVGANVGLFSFAAAHLAGPQGRVLAVEPDAFLSGLLHGTAATLPAEYAPVDVLAVAVADKKGLVRLNIAEGGRAGNSLGAGSSQMGGVRGAQSTLCVTLDWLLEFFPAPDVLKIDVEGLEGAVLRGAMELLTKKRPRIHCEMGGNEAFEMLSELGYAMFDAEMPAGGRSRLKERAFNTIALPL